MSRWTSARDSSIGIASGSLFITRDGGSPVLVSSTVISWALVLIK